MAGRLLRRGAVAMAAAAVALLSVSAPSGALPPDGPSPDTPGTASTVSPRELEAGQSINFSVSGFPPGETVNIKIDDGLNCSQVSVFGACVVHKQRIRSDGTASGSFTVPIDVGTGPHWLRFLASELINGGPESRGYTNRGDSDFTVVEPYTPPPAPAPETTEAPPATTQAPPATTEAPPATTEAPPTTSEAAPTTAAPSVTPTASASLSLMPLSADAVSDDGGGGSGGVVIIGIIAVVVAAAVGGGIILLRNRRGGSAGGAPAP